MPTGRSSWPRGAGVEVTRAAVYCRVSGDEQAKGWSLDGQYRACREYAARMGYKVVRAYREIASGSTPDRPQFQAMVQHGLRGAFDVVVTWKRDRFGRDPVADGFFRRLLGEKGVQVESIDQGPTDGTPHDEFMGYIMDAVARLEARNIAARCHMGRIEMARRGLWPTRPFWGWRRKARSKELEPDPIHAPLALHLFQLVADGVSAQAASRRLGIHHTTAADRIRNTAYKGQASYDGVPVPVPPLVPKDLWDKANATLDATCAHFVRTPRKRRLQQTDKVLSGEGAGQPEDHPNQARDHATGQVPDLIP